MVTQPQDRAELSAQPSAPLRAQESARVEDDKRLGLANYGFRLDERRGVHRHQKDGREIHWGGAIGRNWTVVTEEQVILAVGQGMQELGCFLAVTHQEKSIMKSDRDLIPFARMNPPTERPPK